MTENMTNCISRDRLAMMAAGKIKEREYWLKQLSGAWKKNSFPYDYKNLNTNSSLGKYEFMLSQKLSTSLIKLSGGSDVRLHIILVAGLMALLYRYTNSNNTHEDIVVGCPILKSNKDTDLINRLLILKLTVEPNTTLKELILNVRKTVTEAIAHQNYPIEVLAEQLGRPIERGQGFPLFDVAMEFSNIHDEKALKQVYCGMVLYFSNNGSLLKCIIHSNPTQYSVSAVERIFYHYHCLLEETIANVNIPIANVSYLLPKERKLLLEELNTTGNHFSKDITLHKLVKEQALKNPNGIALTGMTTEADGAVFTDDSGAILTYRELDQKAESLSLQLRLQGTSPGSIVALSLERSMTLIVAILAILKADAVYLPINPKTPIKRTRLLLRDSNAIMIMGREGIEKIAGGICRGFDLLDEKLVLPPVDIPIMDEMDSPIETSSVNNHIAYIIYTSGSTGNPKGVLISHTNIVPLLLWGHEEYGISKNDRVIQNLSFFFDWSVWEIFITLSSGAALYMINDDILLNPKAQVDFIEKNRITVLHITPTQFGYLINVGRKLETLTHLFLGAERLSYDMVRRSLKAVGEYCRVFNMYGPTEATIISSVLEICREDFEKYKDLSSVPIGHTVANTKLLVLDNGMNPCTFCIEGELYIGGDAVSFGYLNDPEKSTGVFVANSFPEIPGAFLYKTGDRVRRLSDGTIEFLGRFDHQVKIRGYRIELGEIENLLLENPVVLETVVLADEYENGEKYLCAYIIPDNVEGVEAGAALSQQLRHHLSKHLPYYMIPDHFIHLEKFPLNANGKIDLKVLPKPGGEDIAELYVAPCDHVEETIAQIWSQLLGVQKKYIGSNSNFFELGGHSLKATTMISEIHRNLDVDVDLEYIFKNPTIREIAGIVRKSEKNAFVDLDLVEDKEQYPLSYNQERIYILHQMNPLSPAYNIAMHFPLKREIQKEIVEEIFKILVHRHESMRTLFRRADDKPIQIICRDVPFEVEYQDISSISASEKHKHFKDLFETFSQTPFQLDAPPLFRINVLKIEEQLFELFFNIHHIVADGWSIEILKKEFFQLLNNPSIWHQHKKNIESGRQNRTYVEEIGNTILEPITTRYRDFVWKQREELENSSNGTNPASEFWMGKLVNGIPLLSLPVESSDQEAGMSSEGAGYLRVIPKHLKNKLLKFAKEHHSSLFTPIYTIYMMYLSRVCRQKDIGCSIIAAGREHTAFKDIVGVFVNSFLFKTNVDANESFEQLLDKVNNDFMQALKFQGYPMERVFQDLGMRYPKVSISINMLNILDESTSQQLDRNESRHLKEARDIKFDLETYITEYDNGIETCWVYRKSLFSPETIEAFVKHYFELLEFFIEHPHMSLKNQRTHQKRKPGRFKKKIIFDDGKLKQ